MNALRSSFRTRRHLAQAAAIASVEPKLADAAGDANLSLRSRAFNDAKVTAHHALIPTPRSSTATALSKNERDVYNLVARRYLAPFFPPFEYFQLDAEITVDGHPHVSRPGTLQIPPTDPIDGFADAGQPSMQVAPDPHALPGTQLLNGPPSFAPTALSGTVESSALSDWLRSVAASATGRHVQAFGTGSYPATQSG